MIARKDNRKIISFAAAALATVSMAGVFTNQVKADKADMVNAPKTESAAHNNEYSGSYTFAPKVMQGVTKVIPFGGNSSDWATSTADGQSYDAFHLNGNEKLKGKVGMMYKNVGTFDNHTIDMKITLMDWSISHDDAQGNGTAASAENYAAFGTDRFSIFTPGESGLKYRVDYLDTKTGEPVKVTGQWTFRDIDTNQFIKFDQDTMNSIDNIYYAGDKKNSDDTWLSYNKSVGAYFSDVAQHPKEHTSWGTVKPEDDRGALTATFSNADHFTISWVYGQNTGKHAAESQARVLGKKKLFNMTGSYDPDAQKNAIKQIYNNVDSSTFAHAYLEYGGQAVLPNKPDKIKKFDSDSDEGTNVPNEIGSEKSVSHDILKNRYEQYHYQMIDDVPDVQSKFKYSKYIITDQLDKVLNVSNVHIYNAAYQDVTHDFTVNVDSNNVLTIAAKDHALQRDDFYREQYSFQKDKKRTSKNAYSRPNN